MVVRLRPRDSSAETACIRADGKRALLVDQDAVAGGQPSQVYLFDRVFDEAAGQAELFAECGRGAVEDTLNGYNATVLAYGQTSSVRRMCCDTGMAVVNLGCLGACFAGPLTLSHLAYSLGPILPPHRARRLRFAVILVRT